MPSQNWGAHKSADSPPKEEEADWLQTRSAPTHMARVCGPHRPSPHLPRCYHEGHDHGRHCHHRRASLVLRRLPGRCQDPAPAVAALTPLSTGNSIAGLSQSLSDVFKEGEKAGLGQRETLGLPKAAPQQEAARWVIQGEDRQLLHSRPERRPHTTRLSAASPPIP